MSSMSMRPTARAIGRVETFYGIGVDLDAALRNEAGQPIPARQRIADGFGKFGLLADKSELLGLMVFVLQNSQNRDGRAVQAKLDELILSSQAANEYVGIVKLDAEALRRLSDSLKEQAKSLDDKADDKSGKSDGPREG